METHTHKGGPIEEDVNGQQSVSGTRGQHYDKIDILDSDREDGCVFLQVSGEISGGKISGAYATALLFQAQF